MSISVRDGKFDVVVVAGPRVQPWPSAGASAISSLCGEAGLSVGLFGGENLIARGVMPLPGTGGIVLAEDSQNRIHRIQARAVVRLSAPAWFPDPFPGWRSSGLIPYSTAIRLRKEGQLAWRPAVVILGTGNQALRLGSDFLQEGVSEVRCIEPHSQWGAKRYAGWEVERRRFEMAGGKIIEGKPLLLRSKSPLVWEFRYEDAHEGEINLEVARVVSCGPFRDVPASREYPPASLLFELEQTAAFTRDEDVEGWATEEERGRLIAFKIIRSLAEDLGARREKFEQIQKRGRARLKRYASHRIEPFEPVFQGKWMSRQDLEKIRNFFGVPQLHHRRRIVACVECFERIPCDLCQSACRHGAIAFSRNRDERFLFEEKCTGCGKCLEACPAGAVVMMHEREDQSTSQLFLKWKGTHRWKVGELAELLNRRGEGLGSGRVAVVTDGKTPDIQIVKLEVPSHLLWEVRGLARVADKVTDEVYLNAEKRAQAGGLVEILVNGEKRAVRDNVPITVALFEMGQGRADDVLFCPDGSCGLCRVQVDGLKKLACQTRIHKGMALKFIEQHRHSHRREHGFLCNCMRVTREHVVERVQQGALQSADAALAVTHVGEGKCHGMSCNENLRRVLLEQGLDVAQWIDWRFPWSEWVLNPDSHG